MVKHTWYRYPLAITRSVDSAPEEQACLQCASPNEDVARMVDFMLSVLSCGYDPARKNAVLFLGGAIHFRAVLTIFDRSNGLARILDCLQTVLMLLHGQQDLKTEKQVRFVSLGVLFPESQSCSASRVCKATREGFAEVAAGSCTLCACQGIGYASWGQSNAKVTGSRCMICCSSPAATMHLQKPPMQAAI